MTEVTYEDLQAAIADLKQRLARSIRHPSAYPPGHYSGLAEDIKTLEDMARQLSPDTPARQRGRRST
jgi:hypothetical protein